MAPESLLVFELQKSHVAFARAIASIPGLEIYAEDVAEILNDDGDELSGHFYLVLPDQAALEQLLRLWELWSNDEDLGPDHAVWASVFECLHDLRRWGPRDRVSREDIAILEDEIALDPDARIQVEFELVFSEDDDRAEAWREDLKSAIEQAGGEFVNECRLKEIAYDAVLARLPAAEVRGIAERRNESLAGHVDVLLIRPQSDVRIPGEAADGEPLEIAAAEAPLPAIAAVLDAVPIQNHLAFSDHVDYDDPEGLESLAVGNRVHGTAMVSLVVRGDLRAALPPLDRKVHVRPLLFAAGGRIYDDEVFHPDRLIVGDFVRAVQRIKIGIDEDPATAPDVLFINVSLGDLKRPFAGRLSAWARALDWIAYEHGVLFIVSAGNAGTLILNDVADDATYRALSGMERAAATLAAVRDAMRDRRILSPGESVNSLTVGALHDDNINCEETRGNSLDPLPIQGGASPFSRLGLGFRNAVKPDLLMPGGRLRVRTRMGVAPVEVQCNNPCALGGLQVAGPRLDAAGRPGFDGWSGASSGATALCTRAAIQIHDALLEAYPAAFEELTNPARALVVKALLAHRTSYVSEVRTLVEEVFGPSNTRQHQKRRANFQRQFGLGCPNVDEAIACLSNRATLWGAGSVGENNAAEFVVPLPASLSGRRGLRKLTATVAWFSPIVTGVRSYKSVRLIVQDPDDAARILTAPMKGQPDQRETARGTLFHRTWEGRQARTFVEDSNVIIPVSRMPDPAIDGLFPELLTFGIAVTLETEADDIPVYVEVRDQLAIRPVVRVPVGIGNPV